ncbi:MAG: M14 family metallopeptidase [Planctomycetota bacterium]
MSSSPSLSFRSLCLLAAAACTTLTAQRAEPPQTVAESSSYEQTSRAADVERFLDACVRLPHGDRVSVQVAGKTHEGRAMMLAKVALPEAAERPRLRALVIGNIHAGEVEGKEAVQELLREFALGQHEPLLQRCEIWFVPIYNVDGNEAVKVGNRRGQNGPDAVGQRPNGQGLDLNRDFVKADAPETRVLLSLFREFDPHLFVDLHTTNGSHHGYHLTYAPSLNPNVDAAVDRFTRGMLERTRKKLQRQGVETFDYGNFETRDWDGGGAPSSRRGERGWYTYDSRARYGINYYGLRNRVSVLSEAYSYADFETRIRATRAFVLGLLHDLVDHEQQAREAMAAADRRVTDGRAPVWFGTATTFADPERLPVLVGKVERVDGEGGRPTRYARVDESAPEAMRVVRRFRAQQQRRLPVAWAVLAPTPEVVQRLQWHGVTFHAVDEATSLRARQFAVDKKRKPKRPYQGHQALVLEGTWRPARAHDIPLGTLIVPADQRLARVAATLLEPLSEDGLSTWNFFEDQTDKTFPVLRLLERPARDDG